MPSTVHIELPHPEQIDGTYIDQLLTEHAGVKGTKKVARSLERYLLHRDLQEKHLRQAQKSVSVINGYRAPYKRGGTSIVEKFYRSLDDNTLRLHCKVFHINLELYETREDIIDALVQVHAIQPDTDSID